MRESLARLSRRDKARLCALALHRAQRRARSGSPSVLPEEEWAARFRGDPDGFIGEVMGPDWYEPTWMAWRVFIQTLFGQPISGEGLAVYRDCTGLASPPDEAQHAAWLPIGRRGGKSRILAKIAAYLATCFDYRPFLSPGEVGFIVVLADSRDHAAAIMNYIKAVFRHSELRGLVKRELVESLELRNTVTIEVVTASISAVRSRTVIAALCDEIAFWPSDETCANPDVEILNGLRPAMATIPNHMLLAASSRYARRGELWKNYRDYFGREEGPLVWSASTKQMNPSISDAFLDEEYERDPVAAAAEYGTEWRTDVAAFIEDEVVEALTPRGVTEVPYVYPTLYHAFCDPSGGAQDSMTLAIAHREGDRGILDRVVERRAPFSPEDVVGEFCEVLDEYKTYVVRGDRYAGEWPREQFAKRGVKYEVSEEPKSTIYREFLPIMTARRCQLLDIRRLRFQITGLERRVARGGRDSIDHPRGQHDDVANSAAGAIVMAAGNERRAVIDRYLGVTA